MPDIENARFITKAIIAEITRYLRSGKCPKEIAKLTGETIYNVYTIINRYKEVHDVFVKTYRLRNPHRDGAPPKMASSLREV